MGVPVVDYHDYISNDDEKRLNFIKNLGDAFSNIGFVIVKNHGVTEELKAQLFEESKKYFELSTSKKQDNEDLTNGGQRGYIGKKRETAKGNDKPDLKEFYHIGQEVTDGDPIKEEYPENIWPKDLDTFKTITTQVYKKFEETGRNLLRATAVYLDLDEDYFTDKIHNGNSILRLLHYYPVSDSEDIKKGSIRAAAHEDINLITLLMGGSAKGLQALQKNGEWLDVSPAEDEIVINIGDMLQRLTNKRLISTTHRVINLDPESMKKPRYSAPFFLHPRSDMDLTCLESCISDENPVQFEPISAGDYLQERIRELKLK